MNQNAFIALIEPFKDKLFRIAKRLLISNEEAEDATQEILTRLWIKKDGLKNYRNIEALAVTMTKNFCLDQLKSKKASNLTLEGSNYIDNNIRLQKKIEETDSVSWVAQIVSQLPEQQKIIFQLRDIEHYEFEEIAQVMEMNETAVRVALSRARKTIREKLLKIHQHGT